MLWPCIFAHGSSPAFAHQGSQRAPCGRVDRFSLPDGVRLRCRLCLGFSCHRAPKTGHCSGLCLVTDCSFFLLRLSIPQTSPYRWLLYGGFATAMLPIIFGSYLPERDLFAFVVGCALAYLGWTFVTHRGWNPLTLAQIPGCNPILRAFISLSDIRGPAMPVSFRTRNPSPINELRIIRPPRLSQQGSTGAQPIAPKRTTFRWLFGSWPQMSLPEVSLSPVNRKSFSYGIPAKIAVFAARRGGRVAEGTCLESRHTRKGIGSSNLPLSAIT